MSGSTPPGCNGSTGTSPAMSTTVACPVDAMYRAAGFDWGTPDGMDLAGRCERWAGLPLLFQPGTEWNYSVATDVLGRVVEVVSGQPLDRFFAERILEPPACLSGGGGLVSTAADYHRFTQLLLRGGELDGVRLLSSRTLRYMTRNHLPGGADLEAFGRPLFAEVLGKLLFWCGEDKIIYGSEAPIWQPQWALEAFWNFQLPQDLVEGYGYPQLTEQAKRKILGENLLRLHGMDVEATRARLRGAT